MPTYEYACQSCGRHVEVFQKFSEDALTTCEVCGGPLRKVFHPAGILFKGSGFYATDSRRSATKGGDAKRDSGSKSSDSKSDSGSKSSDSQSDSGSKSSDSGSKSSDSGSKSSDSKSDSGSKSSDSKSDSGSSSTEKSA
jgi:putative FmdB family regulatory protein